MWSQHEEVLLEGQSESRKQPSPNLRSAFTITNQNTSEIHV